MTRWDCHAHLFGPYAQFALAPERSYTPPEATLARYLALLRQLGMTHGVLVHPSAYGDDHSLLFHALAAAPQLRGVVVARAGGAHGRFAGYRARGIRAARFSARSVPGGNFAGSAGMDDLHALAPVLADAGLHAELWTDTQALPGLAATLQALPVPVVIDHMGGFDPAAGVDAPGFRALLSLLESGKVWVKLCAYRNYLGRGDPQAGRPFHRLMAQANPERLVWGSDWPHLRVEPAPDTASLLALLAHGLDDEAMLERVLCSNPSALYG